MENNITINNRIPQLRFPGYTRDWEEKSFDVICHTITPPLKLQSSQYSSSGKFPIVDQSQTLICGWTNDSSGLLRNTPYIIFGDHTCVLKYIDFPFIQGADGVKILGSNKKDNSKFIYQLLLSNPVKQDGYKRHFSDLKEKIFLLPPTLEEQTKIAECLSSIDEIISVEESKVESLKVHKKGLMQQLFPQPGATTPALRFPGFTGDWEVKKLGEIADVNPKSDKLPNKFVYIDLESVESGNLLKKNIIEVKNAPSRAQRLLKKGDILFQMVRPYQRNNYHFYDNDVNVYVASTGYAQIRYKDCSEYLYQYLHTDTFVDMAVSKCVGGNYPAINTTDLTNITVYLPSPAEQQMIAECLGTLDNLIAAESKKLGFLKSHKKGLMQQLFPQPEK